MQVMNLGTGCGTSVLELVAAFEAACGVKVHYAVGGRRPGDVATLVADASRAARAWGWQPEHDIAAMLRDAWRFERASVQGAADRSSR
jgi:UDP-glucose 4-epimerase